MAEDQQIDHTASPSAADQAGVRIADSRITFADRLDHFLARWGYRRNWHRVEPGLYALGNPTPDAPVFVTANYTLSFDALRSALAGVDGYILVLDTKGINVWCAAGKGTFGTEELAHRIEATRLSDVVNHRRLILPQLGAAGIAAHEVRQRSGFRVKYGPIRAADLPQYLETGRATPEMRRVRFTLTDRVVLIPLELVHVLLPAAIGAAVLFLLAGPVASLAVMAAVLAGVAVFPLLLPWLPSPDFSLKGFVLGGLVALPFALVALLGNPATAWWVRAGEALAYLLVFPPVTAYLALNFTGATTFTSKSGVKREMQTYIPVMAGMFGFGVALTLGLFLAIRIGG